MLETVLLLNKQKYLLVAEQFYNTSPIFIGTFCNTVLTTKPYWEYKTGK